MVRDFAYGKDIGWKDEMIVRQSRYSQRHGRFSVNVVEDSETVDIRFEVSGSEYDITIKKKYETVDEYAEPFDWVTFGDIELSSVVLLDDTKWASEYLLATYWGEPISEGHEEFVRDNVRILQKQFVPRNTSYSLPESATVDSSFDTTDVRTYTNTRDPNPWCRGCLGVIYVNEEVCSRVMEHSASSMNQWSLVDEDTPYIGCDD